MKSLVTSIALACAALAGCAAQVDDSAAIGVSQDALTLQECADQRDTCVRRLGFLGALTICPVEYTACTATASNGLPAQVVDAVAAAAECTDTAASCVRTATTATAIARCGEAEVQCVAGILEVEIPSVVTGTTKCVDTSVDCINAADSVSDLVSCGEDLTGCAVEQASTVIPAEVTDLITSVTDCTAQLNACVRAATTPAQVTACGVTEAECVAGSLNVTLPNVPVVEVIDCTDAAADCALSVERVSDIAVCVEDLQSCAADVVAALEVPPVLDCAQVWTACMTRNPFNFFGCAAERRACERR